MGGACSGGTKVADEGDGKKKNFKNVGDIIKAADETLNLACCPPEDDKPEGLLLTYGFGPIQAVPAAVFACDKVQTLTLKRNEISELPSVIRDLVSLTDLDVSENTLSSLPDEIGELPNLTALDISENSISKLPAAIGKLSQLETLVAFKNQFAQLPDEIGECGALSEVNFFNNKLIKLPKSFSQLSALENLNVGGNKLKTLPSTDNWKQLKEFKCHQNNLVMLPSFAQMTALEFLKMDMNRALQEMPEFGDSMAVLKHLELNSCDFRAVSQSIVGMNALETLNVQGNKIETLPDLANASLDIFNCSSNKIQKLPASLAACKSLRVFFIQGNALTADPESIPEALGALPALERVICDGKVGEAPALQSMSGTCSNNGGWLKTQ